MAQDAEASFDQWMQYAVNYFVLANSGASLAILSFMGGSGSVPIMGVLSLLCFVAGIVVAGLVIMGQLVASWKRFSGDPPAATKQAVEKRWVTRWGDKIEQRTGTYLGAAFGLFVLGAVLGLITLLCASMGSVPGPTP